MTTSAISDVELVPGYYLDPWRDTGAWCTLPWPMATEPKDRLLSNSLGPGIIRWAEWRDYEETGRPGLLHHLTGERWKFTPGQQRFLILWWAYDPETGRYIYRTGVKRGAKGTGKDPFGATWCLANLIGPSYLVQRNGMWVGEQHRMPLVQIASNSEAQSKDVLRVANGMLGKQARAFYGLDCGKTQTNVSGGGLLEVLTASEESSEGDPASAILLNESHHMRESNRGHLTAAVARRNVGKSPREIQARLLECTNAHRQGSDSEGERSYKAWQVQVKGGRVDILYDSIEAPPSTDLLDDASRMAGLKAAYMDSPWSDLERLDGEVLDTRTTVADSIRYYLNGLGAAADAWVDPRKFDACGARAAELVVRDKEQISMFLDCSKSSDATALVGCRISDGHVFVLGVWQKPRGWDEKIHGRWLAPREKVDAIVRETFKRYHAVWFGVDPSPAQDDETEALYWMPTIDAWHRDFHKQLPVWATSGAKIGHSVLFDMRLSQPLGQERNRVFTDAAMQTVVDIEGDDEADPPIKPTLTHDGDPILRQHAHNAKRRPNKWGVSLSKETRESQNKIDAAVCMVGARMGRRIALNSGKLKKRSGRAYGVR